ILDRKYFCKQILSKNMLALKTCKLSFNDGIDCEENLTTYNIENLTTCNHLTIDLSYFQNILALLPLIPHIKSLVININQQKYYYQDYDPDAFEIIRVFVPNLTYLNLNLNFSNVEFEHIESLLICLPQLTHFSCSSSRVELIDGNRWEKLLSFLPLLKTFECVMTSYIYHTINLDIISKSFQTNFWLEREWRVVCDY
ncbi:unnamed protein product, partial [Didymodactylos carnosus]